MDQLDEISNVFNLFEGGFLRADISSCLTIREELANKLEIAFELADKFEVRLRDQIADQLGLESVEVIQEVEGKRLAWGSYHDGEIALIDLSNPELPKIVRDRFSKVSNFAQGVALVETYYTDKSKSESFFLIDSAGKKISKSFELCDGSYLSHLRHRFNEYDGSPILLNKTHMRGDLSYQGIAYLKADGHEIHHPTYELVANGASFYSEGIAWLERGGRFCALDENDKELFSFERRDILSFGNRFNHVFPFHDGVALALKSNYNHLKKVINPHDYIPDYYVYLIDKTGKVRDVKIKIDLPDNLNKWAVPDDAGYFRAVHNGTAFYFNALGEVIIPEPKGTHMKFGGYAGDYSIARAESQDSVSACLIDKKGERVTPYYVKINEWSEGVTAIYDTGGWRLLDQKLNQIPVRTDKKILEIGEFHDGLARIIFNDGKTSGYINKTGRVVFEFTYQAGEAEFFGGDDTESPLLSDFHSGVAEINYGDGKRHYIDRRGKRVF